MGNWGYKLGGIFILLEFERRLCTRYSQMDVTNLDRKEKILLLVSNNSYLLKNARIQQKVLI